MLLSVVIFTLLIARIAANERHILLLNSIIDTESAPDFKSFQHTSRHFQGLSTDELLVHPLENTFLIHVDPERSNQVREQIERDHGLTMGTYLPHNTFVVLATHETADSITEIDGVHWVGNLPQTDKISPTVLTGPETDQGEFISPPNELAEFNITISIGAVNPAQALRLTETNLNSSTSATATATTSSSLILMLSSPLNDEMMDALIDRLRDEFLHDARSNILYRVLIEIIRPDRLRVDVRSEIDLQNVAQVAADDPAVLYVERRMRPRLLNRWARGIVESGLQQSADYTTGSGLLSVQYDLHGQGQVIGIADSGIDYNHCFFYDPNYYPAFKAYKTSPTSADIKPSDFYHRKIAQYVVYGDAGDDSGGHGTHTSATIAGQAQSGSTTYAPYEGMAQQSKLAFFDIGKSDGTLSIPDDLTDSFLGWSYLAGARIHSNSWGVSTPYYTTSARDFDQYMYDHKDFIAVVAAGNDGSCNGQMTLGSPGTAKNIITVGATMTDLDSYTTIGLSPAYYSTLNQDQFTANNIAVFSSKGPTADQRIKPDLVAPGYNTVSAKAGGGRCGQPLSSLLAAKSGTSMATPTIAGNLALIRQYFLDGFYPSGSRNPSVGFVPSGSLIKAVAIAAGTRLTGYRLVTDLFMTNSASCKTPQFVSIAQLPGIDQGWGRLQLNSALKFQSTSATSSLYLLGYNPSQTSTFGDISISAGQTHTYNLCGYRSNLPAPKIVLVWTDPPAQPMSAVQLVNNLDLEVYYQQTGQIHLGNAGVYAGTGPDTRNPVETVMLARVSGPDMNIQVVVRARSINVGLSQPYSLVVTGSVRPSICARTQDVNLGIISNDQLFQEGVTPIISNRAGPASNSTTTPTETLVAPATSTSDEKARTFGLPELLTAAVSAGIVVAFLAAAWTRWIQVQHRQEMNLKNLKVLSLNMSNPSTTKASTESIAQSTEIPAAL